MTDTLAGLLQQETLVKHSRFIVQASPVGSPEAAMDFIHSASDLDATHNCWAWRVGQQFRSSDDGEPSGSAGRPILAAIDGANFDQIAVVVTRWFGGVKLGVGGLVRAYGGCTASALSSAQRIPLLAMSELELSCGFDDLGHVHAALSSFSAEKCDETFSATGARLVLRLPEDQTQALMTHLRNATRGRIHCNTLVDPAMQAVAP